MVSVTEDLDFLFNFHNFKFKRRMVIIFDNTGMETEIDIQTHNTIRGTVMPIMVETCNKVLWGPKEEPLILPV